MIRSVRPFLRASLVACLLLVASPATIATRSSARSIPSPDPATQVLASSTSTSASRVLGAQLAAAAPSGEGIDLEASSTYVLDDAARLVHVTYEARVTNTEPSTYTFYSIITPYLAKLGIPVQKEATNVVASHDDGSTLPVSIEGTDSPFVSIAVIDLEPDLFYPDTQVVRLSYDLPPQPARSAGVVRLNEAFATFPTFAIGDPGKTTVKVVVPERYDVELIGDDLVRSEVDGQQVFLATGIGDPDAFFANVVARDDGELMARHVELGKEDVRVLGWPDDAEWVDFVADQVRDGVPALSQLIGLPWPAKRRLDVTETVSPYIYGYAGWYSPEDSTIEIGDELDQQVILHELSHLWFNDDLFTDRWVDEALADVYAAHAMTALGDEAPVPDPIDPAATGAIALNDWSDPLLQDDIALEQEAYGYNASWSVLDQIADEVGIDKLSAVVREAAKANLTYAAEGRSYPLRVASGWHQLLDLLQDRAGSTLAEPLFWTSVASTSDRSAMADRAALRTAYAELTAAGGGWAPPLPVRMAMSRWQFSSATSAITEARELVPLRDQLVQQLTDLGVGVPASIRTAWETTPSLAELRRELETDLAAARSVAEQRAAPGGPLAALGRLMGRDDLRLLDARRNLAAGDFAGAATTTASIERRLEEATRSGVARASALLALVGAGLLLRRSKLRPPADWPARVARGTVPAPDLPDTPLRVLLRR